MKIIFSPSKEMTFENPVCEEAKYSEKTKRIIEELKKLNSDELKKLYKVSDKVLEEVEDFIENFDKKESYRSIEMYSGLSFRTFDATSLTEDDRKYLENRLKILSAFYGPVSPERLIRPYRLDFNTKLKINGESLKKFWKDEFNNSFEDGEEIINIASKEFSDLLDRDKFKIIDYEFFENKGGKLKSHSTISKKARGLMLRFLCVNKVVDVEGTKKFNLDGFEYREDLSEEGKFVFVKE
ncbi:peroxide stress protein YaaA [Peptoniphilus sp.]|jgi:cytoplasmic iron level regulating protein YaaA (DUF328/UPF0246 family)|uniref:peroxide stress protein YaaA n=1 Tax=Peptoniphilus sp. TaxID=1971214 RepID=UPI003D9276EE